MKRQKQVALCYEQATKNKAEQNKEAETFAIEFWNRWGGKDRGQMVKALLFEVDKIKDDSRVAEVLCFAKIINKHCS